MATAEQIMSLIRSHSDDDDEHFYTIALQIASHEARRGHKEIANEIRDLYKARHQRGRKQICVPEDLMDILVVRPADVSLNQLVLNKDIQERITRILREYVQQELLKSYGLSNRRKILFIGPSGTGKSMTAEAIAHTLQLPFIAVQLDLILSRYMGESSAKLHQVFNFIREHQALYLFDEFDTLATMRDGNDIGEMRRILNTLLVRIEQDASDSIIVAASNMPDSLDKALFRRFDDRICYSLPDHDSIGNLIRNSTGSFLASNSDIESLVNKCTNLSCADIVNACQDAVKDSILQGRNSIRPSDIERTIFERSRY